MVTKPKRELTSYFLRDAAFHSFDASKSDVQSLDASCGKLIDFIFLKKSYKIAFRKLVAMQRELTEAEEGFIEECQDFISKLKDSNNHKQLSLERERKLKLDAFFSNFGDVDNEAIRAFRLWAFSDKNTQMSELRGDSGFGIMLFCAALEEMPDFPIIDLEFDCKGTVVDIGGYDNDNNPLLNVIISAGEIKPSVEGIPKAKSQLLRRLIVLKKGVELCYVTGAKIHWSLQGVVFLPAEAKSKVSSNTNNNQYYSLKFEFVH